MFVAFAVAQFLIPFVIRKTASVYFGCMAFGTLAYSAITAVAIAEGGFAIHVLLWTLVVPVAFAWQRQYRSLVPIWVALCLVQWTVFYTLATTGHSPTSVALASESTTQLLGLCSLVAWLALLLLISMSTSSVTYEFSDARDAYRRALLHAQKLDALGKLAGGIENNFNNALMSMDYASHLLGKSLDANAPEQEEISELGEVVSRAKALSRKLERLGAAADERPQCIQVDEAVKNLEKILTRLVSTWVVIEMDLEAGAACVRCDPNQLDQVLINLAVNAGDAISSSGTITVSTRATDDFVLLEVRDTGAGIDKDLLARVFEPFFTTKDQDSGTGLGLWICRSIVQTAGGTLTADSEVGVGTTMHIELPRAEPAALDDIQSPTEVLSRRASRRAPRDRSDVNVQRRLSASTWHALEWFVEHVSEQRERVWGAAIVGIAFAATPFFLGFGVWYYIAFGFSQMAITLIVSAGCCALTPLLLRVTRRPLVGAVALGVIAFVALSMLALARGGFPVQILMWTAVIPVAAALQQEFRQFARIWGVAIFAQYFLAYALAATGAAPDPVAGVSEAHQLTENLVVLVAVIGLLLAVFRTTATVQERFAAERDGFEAALVKSHEFELLGTFAGSIAHDLNNVLTPLEFSISILDARLPPQHPGRSDVADLRSAGARVQALSRQLSRFSRADDDEIQHLYPTQVLLQLEPMLAPILGSHIDLRMEMSAELAGVVVRPRRLDQIMINLALNARDAMPDGGVLTITTEADAGTVTISVSDTGIGVPDEIHHRLCEPFFTMATDDDRLGLGLWVCKELVAEAHGELRVVSEVGNGTTVHIALPRAVAGQELARGTGEARPIVANQPPTSSPSAAADLARRADPSTQRHQRPL